MSGSNEQLGMGGPVVGPGPYVLASKLHAELAAYREAAGMTQAEVAEELDCSGSKVHRNELGPNLPDRQTLEAMLALYGAADAAERLVDSLHHIKQLRTVLRKRFPGVPPHQLDFEDHELYAREIFIYERSHVPEFLLADSFGSYADAAREASIPRKARPDWVDRSVARRREHLLRPDGPAMHIIVDERAILVDARQPAGQTQSPAILDTLIRRLNAVNTIGQRLRGEPVDPALNLNVAVQMAAYEEGSHPLSHLLATTVWMRFPEDTLEPHGYFAPLYSSEFMPAGADFAELEERFTATMRKLPGPEKTRDIMAASREATS